jgi:hypothetical protein
MTSAGFAAALTRKLMSPNGSRHNSVRLNDLSLRQTRFDSTMNNVAGNESKLKATLGIRRETGYGARARIRLGRKKARQSHRSALSGGGDLGFPLFITRAGSK